MAARFRPTGRNDAPATARHTCRLPQRRVSSRCGKNRAARPVLSVFLLGRKCERKLPSLGAVSSREKRSQSDVFVLKQTSLVCCCRCAASVSICQFNILINRRVDDKMHRRCIQVNQLQFSHWIISWINGKYSSKGRKVFSRSRLRSTSCYIQLSCDANWSSHLLSSRSLEARLCLHCQTPESE